MRALIVTAVPAERDAVVRGIRDAGAFEGVERALPGAPGYARHRLALPVTGASDALTLEALDADVLAAGVGPAASAAATGSALATATADGLPYDLVVSAGIGGGFGVAPAIPPAGTESTGTESTGTGSTGTASPGAGQAAARPVGLALAAVVVADAIVAADLGAETPDGFAAVTDLGFGTIRHLPPAHLVRAAAEATGGVRGSVLTVSTVTGSAERAAELMARHPGAVAEAMEGFGVAEAATAYGVPVLEIRTVSNAVGPRDRAAWRIDAALAALSGAFDALARALPRAMAENGAPTDPAGTARGSSALHEAASDAAAGDGPT
ncbi:futalosine hydrolase [Streptomyces buecherae]|uniref:futalosine hydrolase n=1 Tax=Streptomyces buecherae TaxID=2763006 RepID=UPI0036924E7A